MSKKRIAYKTIKRAFDIGSSSAAIVLTSPLWMISAVKIKMSSPGPVFYKSHRVCKNNKPFTMYKFRSMHVFKPEHEGQRSEGSFVGNSRIFKYGNFMRKTKIDELPQFLNVLLGQMSIVGPRPVSKESSEKNYVGDYSCITAVKPGLACLDSLFDYKHGELVIQDDNEYREKIIPMRRELAKLYCEKQGLKTDLDCILKTIKLLFEIGVTGKREFPYTEDEKIAYNRLYSGGEDGESEFSNFRVLVMDGGGKQTLAMVRGLKEIGCHVTVLCSSKFDTCYVSNKPDEVILNPDLPNRDEEVLRFLLDLAASGKYDVLMPIGELSTNFVTEHEEAFTKYVKLACAPREVYIKAFNKQITFDQAMKSGIPCPYTRKSDQDIQDFLDTCTFPVIIKPRQGLGSIGFHKFEKKEDFWPYMKEKGLDPDDYVVQEFVEFENRIGTNLFVDQKGNICTSYAVDVLRWFPVDAGAGVLIVTVDAHEVLQYAGKLLQDLGWKGFANVAFMIDKKTGEPRLLEINGRIPASVKMAFMCGCNVSEQFLQMIYDKDVTQYPENDKFGMYIRHMDTDLAWFLKSRDRFKTKPSWFSWKNTQEIIYSRDDKRPFFYHLVRKVASYKEIMARKKH